MSNGGPNPIIGNLGGLLLTTEELKKQGIKPLIGPQVEGEEIKLPPARQVGPDDLRAFVAPAPPAPVVSKKEAWRAQKPLFGTQGRLVESMMPKNAFRPYAEAGGPPTPKRYQKGLPWTEVLDDPEFVGAPSPLEMERKPLLDIAMSTAATSKMAEEQTDRTLRQEHDYQRRVSRFRHLTRKPVETWDIADEEFLRELVGPKNLKAWKESEYEEFFPEDHVNRGDDDFSRMMKSRRFLRRAAYYKLNPTFKAMALNMTLPQLWMSENKDLAAYGEAAAAVRKIMYNDDISDDQKVDEYREVLVGFYGNVVDYKTKKPFGVDAVRETLQDPGAVMNRVSFLLKEEAAAANVELNDRRQGFWRAVDGPGSTLPESAHDATLVSMKGAKSPPPLTTMAKLWRARYQIPVEDLAEIITKDQRFVNQVAIKWWQYNEAVKTKDRSEQTAIAEEMFALYMSMVQIPEGKDATKFGLSGVGQLLNHVVTVPARAWDGVTYEIGGRPVVPMKDTVFFSARDHMETRWMDKATLPNMWAFLSPEEQERLNMHPSFNGSHWMNMESGFDPTRKFDLVLGGDNAYMDMGDEMHETFMCDLVPQEVLRRLSKSGFDHWGRVLTIGLVPSPAEMYEGVSMSVDPASKDFGIQTDLKTPGIAAEDVGGLVPVNDMMQMKDSYEHLDNVFNACFVDRDLAFRAPGMASWGEIYKRMAAYADVQDGTALRRILTMRYAVGMTAEEMPFWSIEHIKAESLMARSMAFQVVHFLAKMAFEGVQQEMRLVGSKVAPVFAESHDASALEAEAEGDYWAAASHRDSARELRRVGEWQRKEAINDLSVFADGLGEIRDHMVKMATKYDYTKRMFKTRTIMSALDLAAVADAPVLAAKGGVYSKAKLLKGASGIARMWAVGGMKAHKVAKVAASLAKRFKKVEVVKPAPNMTSVVLEKPVKDPAHIPADLTPGEAAIAPSPKRAKAKADEAAKLEEAAKKQIELEKYEKELRHYDILPQLTKLAGFELGKQFPTLYGGLFDTAASMEFVAKHKIGVGTIHPRLSTAKLLDAPEGIPSPLPGEGKTPVHFTFQQIGKKLRESAQLGGPVGRALGSMLLSRQHQMSDGFVHVVEKGRAQTNSMLFIGYNNMLEALAGLHVLEVRGGMKTLFKYVAEAFEPNAQKNAIKQEFSLRDLSREELAHLESATAGAGQAVNLAEGLFGRGASMEVFRAADGNMVRFRRKDGSAITFAEADKALRAYLDPQVQMLVYSEEFAELILNPDGKFAKKFFNDAEKLEGLLNRGVDIVGSERGSIGKGVGKAWSKAKKGEVREALNALLDADMQGFAIGRTARREVERLRRRLEDDPPL